MLTEKRTSLVMFVSLILSVSFASCGKKDSSNNKDVQDGGNTTEQVTALSDIGAFCANERVSLLNKGLISEEEKQVLEEYGESAIFIEDILLKTFDCADQQVRQKIEAKAADELFRSFILSQRAKFNECEAQRKKVLESGKITRRIYINIKLDNYFPNDNGTAFGRCDVNELGELPQP